MTFAQALTALREHASQCGRAHSDDPDQLLPDIDIHLQRPSPAAIRNSGLGRLRARRDQDIDSAFGISNCKLSTDVTQSNSGLGAALLSVLNDIVAHDSDQNRVHPQQDIDSASSNDDMNEELDVNMFKESSTPDPALEKGTMFHVDVEFESPKTIVTSVASSESCNLSQTNVVSGDLLVSERSVGVIVPLQTKLAASQMMMTGHLEDVVPPTLGVATPRRAKVIQTGYISQEATHATSGPPQSVQQEEHPENFGEMDM